MRVQIAARHCDVPEPITLRIRQQLERLTRFDSRISSAETIFTEEKRVRRVEVILHVDRVAPIVAHAEADDFTAAVSRVIDRLERMVKDQRAKFRDHQAQGVPGAADAG